jgi:hypothetical protein
MNAMEALGFHKHDFIAGILISGTEELHAEMAHTCIHACRKGVLLNLLFFYDLPALWRRDLLRSNVNLRQGLGLWLLVLSVRLLDRGIHSHVVEV